MTQMAAKWKPGTRVNYLEFLVINGTDENVCAERFAGDSRREEILALIIVAVIDENLGNVFDLISAERRAVMEFTCARVMMRGRSRK